MKQGEWHAHQVKVEADHTISNIATIGKIPDFTELRANESVNHVHSHSQVQKVNRTRTNFIYKVSQVAVCHFVRNIFDHNLKKKKSILTNLQ